MRPSSLKLSAADDADKAAPTLTERWGFAEVFMISQTALPAILFLPGTQPLRLPIRVASYGISLEALAWWYFQKQAKPENHPAFPWLKAALGYTALMILHPTTNSYKSALAQVALYLSVLAPFFWAPAFVTSPERLRRVLWVLLACNGVNSMVGVMQVFDPETFMPQEFSRVMTSGSFGLGTVTYKGIGGIDIIRPPGLFDTPGAVCGPGMFAGVLGLIFCLDSDRVWKRLVAFVFAFAGVSAIYFTLVRSSIIVLAGMIIIYATLQQVQQNKSKLFILIGLSAALGAGGFFLAAKFGGDAITDRFSTLLETKPAELYYNARGNQVENGMLELLPEYPFGAGVGRWGMMNYYFGDPDNLEAPGLWAEIQFPGWILDGGIILLLCYSMALISTAKFEFRVAREAENPQIRALAATVLSANAGIVALCFSFVPFNAQAGLQYWFLSGGLQRVAKEDPAAASFGDSAGSAWRRRLKAKPRPKPNAN